MDFGDAAVIAGDEAVEDFGEPAAGLGVDPAHDPEVDRRQPAVGEQAAGAVHPGQWRLARVEVVNWGTFQGRHAVDVAREGFLITGESGSGKSSLIDAISAVVRPPTARSVSATREARGTAGWQHRNSTVRLSS